MQIVEEMSRMVKQAERHEKKEKGNVDHHKMKHWKRMNVEVNMICGRANTEITVAVLHTRVSQKSLSSLRQYNAGWSMYHLATKSEGEGQVLLIWTFTYISTCPSEGTEKYCIKKQQQQHHSWA